VAAPSKLHLGGVVFRSTNLLRYGEQCHYDLVVIRAREIHSLLRDLTVGVLVCSLLAPLIALPLCTVVWVAILQLDRKQAHSLPELWALTSYVGHALFVYMTKSLAMLGAVLGVIEATLLRWTKTWGRTAQTFILTFIGACLGAALGACDGTMSAVSASGLYVGYCGLLLAVLAGSKSGTCSAENEQLKTDSAS